MESDLHEVFEQAGSFLVPPPVPAPCRRAGLGESPRARACRPGPSPERHHEGEAAHLISSAEFRLEAPGRLMPRSRQ